MPDRTLVYKVNIETEDTLFVTELITEQGGRPEGCFITAQYDPLSLVMLAISNADEGFDRLDIWQLDAKDKWMQLDVTSGELEPDAEQELTLAINATDLAPMVYPGELRFTHNGFGGETFIPVDLTVTPLGVGDGKPLAPLDFSIESIHPNPFNSTATIKYSLPTAQHLTASIYDISGRRVETLYDDVQSPGHQSLVWSADRIGSGVYFVQVQSENEVRSAKLVVIK